MVVFSLPAIMCTCPALAQDVSESVKNECQFSLLVHGILWLNSSWFLRKTPPGMDESFTI
jgi:hypothetical protein